MKGLEGETGSGERAGQCCCLSFLQEVSQEFGVWMAPVVRAMNEACVEDGLAKLPPVSRCTDSLHARERSSRSSTTHRHTSTHPPQSLRVSFTDVCRQWVLMKIRRLMRQTLGLNLKLTWRSGLLMTTDHYRDRERERRQR